MYREFEGKTEQEAVALAIAELQIDRQDFDVEIVDTGRKGLFKKGPVKIRVHLDDEKFEEVFEEVVSDDESVAKHVISEEFEQEVIDFVTTLLVKMGFPGSVEVVSRKEGKLGLDIVSSHSAIIIGRKGKNLDAIQLLANVYAGKLDEEVKVVIDSENYRMRHEEQLVRMAFKTAEQVKRSGKSRLLEPMNPFERRLIHTALNGFDGVQTKSEGDGLYKQVRILRDDDVPPLRS
jgi:spoIIIJ-associated protein